MVRDLFFGFCLFASFSSEAAYLLDPDLDQNSWFSQKKNIDHYLFDRETMSEADQNEANGILESGKTVYVSDSLVQRFFIENQEIFWQNSEIKTKFLHLEPRGEFKKFLRFLSSSEFPAIKDYLAESGFLDPYHLLSCANFGWLSRYKFSGEKNAPLDLRKRMHKGDLLRWQKKVEDTFYQSYHEKGLDVLLSEMSTTMHQGDGASPLGLDEASDKGQASSSSISEEFKEDSMDSEDPENFPPEVAGGGGERLSRFFEAAVRFEMHETKGSQNLVGTYVASGNEPSVFFRKGFYSGHYSLSYADNPLHIESYSKEREQMLGLEANSVFFNHLILPPFSWFESLFVEDPFCQPAQMADLRFEPHVLLNSPFDQIDGDSITTVEDLSKAIVTLYKTGRTNAAKNLLQEKRSMFPDKWSYILRSWPITAIRDDGDWDEIGAIGNSWFE